MAAALHTGPAARGLGKPSVEKLLALRAAVLRLQEKFSPETDLNPVLSQSLAQFNDCEEGLIISHFRDELLGQLNQAMQLDCNMLILEMDEADCRRQQLLGRPIGVGKLQLPYRDRRYRNPQGYILATLSKAKRGQFNLSKRQKPSRQRKAPTRSEETGSTLADNLKYLSQHSRRRRPS